MSKQQKQQKPEQNHQPQTQTQPNSKQIDPSNAYLRRIQENHPANQTGNRRFPPPDYPGAVSDMAMTPTIFEATEPPDILRSDDPYHIPRPKESSDYRKTSPHAFLQRNS